MNGGFLLVYKDNDLSSNKIDQRIKHKYHFNKVGHLGTLDPLAKGLLVLGINDYTKMFKYFENLDKTYILTIRLGATSPSLDNETAVTIKKDTDLRGKEEYIDKLLSTLQKEMEQIPPLYSAIKVSGVPSYIRINNDESFTLTPRIVNIYKALRLDEIKYIDGSSYFNILLHVSKGFYVRSFAFDFANLLNTYGMAEKIERIQVGRFNIDDSVKFSELGDGVNLIDPIKLLNFEEIEVENKDVKKVLNGTPLKLGNEEFYILKNKGNSLAIYKKDNDIHRMDLLIER